MAKGITLYQLVNYFNMPVWVPSDVKKEFFGFMVGMNHFNKKTAYFFEGTFLIGYMQYGGGGGGGGGILPSICVC